MEVRLIRPDDEDGLAEWHGVLHAVEKDEWPALSGYSLRDVRAYANQRSGSRRFEHLAAGPPGGPMDGVAVMEAPLRDNRHCAWVTVAVHPERRRRGAGTALVERISEEAGADGRRVLNAVVDVPVDRAQDHPSVHFAERLGFERTLPGNRRQLSVPVDPARLDALREVVTGARGAADYQIATFVAPWPAETVDDHCELMRRMSTDQPSGDDQGEEEVWDRARIDEADRMVAARGCRKLVAVARHVPSGRLVAFTELLVCDEAPSESWQMDTLVHPDHRGHRLGLAVKLANLDFLTAESPTVRLIVTGNAQTNAPMIAVNDMLGFEVASVGMFWQKHVQPPGPHE